MVATEETREAREARETQEKQAGPAGPADRATFVTVLRNRSFLLLWVGQLISNLGDAFANIAVLILVSDLSRSALALSGLMLADLVPVVFAGPVIGVLVDRWDRKKILITADLVRGGLFLLLAFRPSLPMAYAVGLLTTLASLFFNPARGAVVPELVGSEALTAAVGLSQSTTQATNLGGPLVGGALVGFLGTGAVFAFNGFTFFASAVAITLMAFPAAARFARAERAGATDAGDRGSATARKTAANSRDSGKEGFAGQLAFGLRFLARDPLLRFIVILFAGVGALAGFVNVGYINYTRKVLALAPVKFGLVMTAQGLGAVLGAVLMGNIGSRVPRGRATYFSLLGLLAGLGLYVFHPGYLALTSLMFLTGFLNSTLSVPSTAIFYGRTPVEVRGRVFSMANSILGGLGLISYPVAGLLGDVFGPAETVGYAGLVGFLAALAALGTAGGRALLDEK